MLPLYTRGTLSGMPANDILKVLSIEETLAQNTPLERVLVALSHTSASVDLEALAKIGVAGALCSEAPSEPSPIPILSNLESRSVVSPGDVIRLNNDGRIYVLYRRGANANSLFVTERCNNLCLMCSQPPTPHNDDWRVDEIIELLPLIDKNIDFLGVTGGEPTLLGPRLVQIIDEAVKHLPNTYLHILTNGRNFSDPSFTSIFNSAKGKVQWAIPLYADTAFRHDYVVQVPGAFEESLNGLYNLAERGHRIEIRFVIHAQTHERMEQFAEFVYRNLPFVEHVAFMGLEPMGFAKVNKETLWIDPIEYSEDLTRACWYLNNRGIASSIYNVPLCLLPRSAWPLAQKSISDWKNIYEDECRECSVKEHCCGFFASLNSEWKSKHIKALVGKGVENEPKLEKIS